MSAGMKRYMHGLPQRMLRTQPMSLADDMEGRLKRVLRWWDLAAYGVASTVGAGIFVITGQAAKTDAGPAITISYLVAAFVSLISALCYSEFAARVPVSGSAYSFAYLTLGEFIAWQVGWNLTLEYCIGGGAVARGFAGYWKSAFSSVGVDTWSPLMYIEVTDKFILCPMAVLVIVFACLVCLVGIKDTAAVNVGLTCINVGLLLLVIVAGATHFNSDNFTPFAPFGFSGILRGASKVFFSYVGFDCVCSMSSEVANPQVDLPLGVLGTLAIAALLYVGASGVLTGMMHYSQLSSESAYSTAFAHVHSSWATHVVGFGALTVLTANVIVSLLGQPRIFFQMAYDGLVPEKFAATTGKGVPWFGTIVSSLVAASLAFCFDVDELASMISIGTLLAFTLVCGGIVILAFRSPTGAAPSLRWEVPIPPALRKVMDAMMLNMPATIGVFFCFVTLMGFSFRIDFPFSLIGALPMGLASLLMMLSVSIYKPLDVPETFACPGSPFIPMLGMALNMTMVAAIDTDALLRFIVWTILGTIIYFGYGIKHSKLAGGELQIKLIEDGQLSDEGVQHEGGRAEQGAGEDSSDYLS